MSTTRNLALLKDSDPRLRIKAEEVVEINEEIREIFEFMYKTMIENGGIGLAATQINYHKRLVVIDIDTEEEDIYPLYMINPKIIFSSRNSTTLEEGCLSVTYTQVEINRPETIKCEYLDLEGKTRVIKANGLLAKAIQHEIDHLNGKLIIDYQK